MLENIIATFRQAFRSWIRRKTMPFTVEEAQEKQLFWAKAYALSGIFLLISTTVYVFKKKLNFGSEKGLSNEMVNIMSLSGNLPVKMIKIGGLNKVEETVYTVEEVKELKKQISEKLRSAASGTMLVHDAKFSKRIIQWKDSVYCIFFSGCNKSFLRYSLSMAALEPQITGLFHSHLYK